MANARNEKVKRRYFKLLREANGYSEATIAAIERALHLFEQYTDNKEFSSFSERQAVGFKKWLAEGCGGKRKLSVTSRYHHLRHVKAFFTWLSTQQGFRSKITLDAVSYLTLDKRSRQEAIAVRPREFPSLEQVVELVESIDPDPELNKRDRAIIAFMFMSGIRYTALCSLSVASFDAENLVVHQDPRLGVQTKGGKLITTKVLPFDQKLVDAVLHWHEYLLKTKQFGPSDPLFPSTQVAMSPEGSAFEANGVKPVFWQGGNSIREILQKHCKAAGLSYFNPHSFRHAYVHQALKACRSPEQLKALSQNIGHEQVTTTLRSYGMLDQERVFEVLGDIDYQADDTVSPKRVREADLIKALREAGIRLDK